MSFEDIPEDAGESYPCPDCGKGNIVLSFDESKFECDTCTYEPPVISEE